jgi:hypothetical protein
MYCSTYSDYEWQQRNFYNSEPYLRLKLDFYEARDRANSDPENTEKQQHAEYLFGTLNHAWEVWSNYGTFNKWEIEEIRVKRNSVVEQQRTLDLIDPIVEVTVPLDATHYKWGGMDNPGGDVLTWFKCEEFIEMPSIAFSLYTGITYKVEKWYYKTENNRTWKSLECNPSADKLPPRKEKLSGRKSTIYGRNI